MSLRFPAYLSPQPTTGPNLAHANDLCANALNVDPLPFGSIATTTGATSDFATTTCSVASTDVGIWYEFTGGDKIVEIEATQATFNTRFSLFEGATCEEQTCKMFTDIGGFNNFMSFAASSSETYRLLVSGVSGTSGSTNIDITVSDLLR